jgi:hypothetical protein
MDSKIILGKGGALPRGSCKCEGPSSGMTHFSTTNGSNFHEWEAASPEILLVGFIRVYSGYSWFKNIWAGWGGRRGLVIDEMAIGGDGNLGGFGRFWSGVVSGSVLRLPRKQLGHAGRGSSKGFRLARRRR